MPRLERTPEARTADIDPVDTGVSAQRSTVRFGVICPPSGAVTPAQAIVIRKILELHETELAVAVLLTGSVGSSDTEPAAEVARTMGRVPLVSASTLERDGRYHVAADSVRAAGITELSLLLDFSGAALAGEILDLPKFGVWTFVHEISREQGISVASLVRLCDGGTSAVTLASCVLQAEPVSVANNRSAAMSAAVDLPARTCKLIVRGEMPELVGSAGVALPRQGGARLTAARTAIESGIAWARSQLEGLLFVETWNVGVIQAAADRFLDPAFKPAVNWLPSVGRHKFIADPFVAETARGIELFVEEFDYDRGHGYICSATWASDTAPKWTSRIDYGIHMSYPFALQYDGALYVVPESSLSREVNLYRVDPSTGSLDKVRTLIQGFAAVDPTLVEFEGRWWLFCTCRGDSPDSKLYLWTAPSLFGRWEQHPLNPIKCDVRSSRPGGPLFRHNGSLYRPAQDSSGTYGRGMAINRVTRLTLEDFSEEVVVRVRPIQDSPYNDGIHTLSSAGSVTVIDGKQMAFRPMLSARRLRHKVRRLSGVLQGGHDETSRGAA